LFVASDGKVGIGTASPAVQLHVNGTGFVGLNITSDSTSETQLRFLTNTAARITNQANTALIFDTNALERLRIDSSGRVGIGTSSPGAGLHVANLSVWAGATTASASGVIAMYGDGNNGTIEAFAGNSTSTKRNVCIAPYGGNVGIGTSSPGAGLHVAGNARIGVNDTSVAELQIGAGATGNRLALIDLVGDTTYSDFGLRILRDNTGANANSQIQHRGTGEFRLITNEASPLVFWTQGSERARIDSSGRLLVGTSTARSIGAGTFGVFEVEQAGIAIATINTNTNGAEPAILVLGKSRGTTIGSSTVVQNNDQLGEIRFAGGDGTDVISLGASILAAVDGTPGANDMPGRLVFSVTADGAASPTEALRISNDRSITVSDGGNVVLGTTTGTKIGTATTQKLGFYNATPVVQPTAVADATDAATVITQLNALLAKLRTLGIIAT
jgi:hypothetical protein